MKFELYVYSFLTTYAGFHTRSAGGGEKLNKIYIRFRTNLHTYIFLPYGSYQIYCAAGDKD